MKYADAEYIATHSTTFSVASRLAKQIHDKQKEKEQRQVPDLSEPSSVQPPDRRPSKREARLLAFGWGLAFPGKCQITMPNAHLVRYSPGRESM